MNHVKGNSASSLSTQPPSTLQVDAQFDSARFSMEVLESTVDVLMGRLIPVTGEVPVDPSGGEVAAILVPVAQHISYLEYRVRAVEARLSAALRQLQV